MKKNILSAFALLLCFSNLSNAQTITTVAGNGTAGFSGDGNASTSSQLNTPFGMCYDPAGNLYIADALNNRIRKISPVGIITTAAGNGTAGYSGDGGPATSAMINRPTDVTSDAAGNLYIADESNFVVRKVSTSGIITTYAGINSSGYTGDGGLATSAKLSKVNTVSMDKNGNLYLSVYENNVIRKVNASGFISTVAGNGIAGFSGDGGQATSAKLNSPCKVAFDTAGNWYIADEYNSRIRKVNTSGVITTVAGNGTAGFSGDGSAATSAEISYPESVLLDEQGNIYFGDKSNNRIRKVNTSGIITTIAGNGTAAYTGDGGLATSASLHNPEFTILATNGDMYITDASNNAVRKVTNVAVGVKENSSLTKVEVSPVPTTGTLLIISGNEMKTYEVRNELGQLVASGNLSEGKTLVNIAHCDNGIYFVHVFSLKGSSSVSKVVLEK